MNKQNHSTPPAPNVNMIMGGGGGNLGSLGKVAQKSFAAFVAALAMLVAMPTGALAQGSGSSSSSSSSDIYHSVSGSNMAVMNIAAFGIGDVGSANLSRQSAAGLSRAQYTDGLWAQVNGGKINNREALLEKNTFQTVKIGFDRTFDANGGGIWNAGVFTEGNWMHGKTQRAVTDAKSETTGVGFGYYLSREFRNLTYIDFVGRTTWFENDSYYGGGGPVESWKNDLFSAGLEIGRTFNSRDGRWTLNPYNRLMYNSASATEIKNNANDLVIHGYGVWTNRLGARLTLTPVARRTGYFGQSPCDMACSPCDMADCNPCDPCGTGMFGGRVNTRYFTGIDWYKGFSGKYGATDDIGVFAPEELARPKHNISYGVVSAGVVLYPTKRTAITFAGESIFGDINGYGLSLTAKRMF